MTPADADLARHQLHQVREELTARALAADEPTGFCRTCSIYGLDGMHATMDLAGTGALVTELISLSPATFDRVAVAAADG
jgi:hypothetical protein